MWKINQMYSYIIAYIGALVIFCAMDFIWLAVVAKKIYQIHMGALMLTEPNWVAAAIFYLLYILGLLVFAVIPALRSQSFIMALNLGAFLGLIAYGSYDLTNLATLKGWSLTLSVIDISWGIVVSAVASSAGFMAVRFFEKI
jgi:uncharacterized membrane protein